jgi:hypothetical protein
MTSHYNITIIQAGCWTHFLLWISCVPVKYKDNVQNVLVLVLRWRFQWSHLASSPSPSCTPLL